MRNLQILSALAFVAGTATAQPTSAIQTAQRTADAANARTEAISQQQAQVQGQTTEQKAGSIAAGSMLDTTKTGKAGRTMPALTREVFQYDGGGRRDPFLSLVKTGALRPLLSELTLTTTMVGRDGRTGNATLYDATAKERYLVKVGDTIGRYRVVKIENKSVTFAIVEFGTSRLEVLAMNDSTKVRNQ